MRQVQLCIYTFLFHFPHLTLCNIQLKVINAYIRLLKARTNIQQREDGGAYLETSYDANMIGGDTVASLRVKDAHNFRMRRTLTYLYHDMVFFPINVNKSHWYLVVINATKCVIQVLDSKGPATHRPELVKLVIN
ncbi:hypothetical protein HU200_013579 [Digitaria exilis]|uniref:Ubiquitin-like protease family profile domain-containing protein n=1 Tax=Digitaria exilis TaxID=1010633 RepID=A0A835FD61_9POAL|nr:hypothetical protein HU200_013579 [Digitaria exilis]